jgi:hypothetical protein
MTDKLYREIEEAKALRLYLADAIKGDATSEMTEDDQQTLQDTFDGQTDSLKDAIRAAYLSIVEDQICIVGIEAVVSELNVRLSRLGKREEATRGRILQAMTVAEWDSLPLDVATLVRTKVKDKVVIDEESEIPTQFFKRGDPTLDKAALSKAVKERQKVIDEITKTPSDPGDGLDMLRKFEADNPPIPGCHIESGGKTLTIRKA